MTSEGVDYNDYKMIMDKIEKEFPKEMVYS